jgi:hypothetical protein
MRGTGALIASLALAVAASPAAADTYYVSPSGSDAAAGTADAPWQSVAKVNAFSFRPGDQVLFQGGGVWTGMLQPRTSGTAAAPIVFASYGTGRPVLEGSGASGYAGIVVAPRAYLTFRDFEVRDWHGGDEMAYITGAHDIVFDNVYGHDADNGILGDSSAPPSAITIENSRILNASNAGGGMDVSVPAGASGWVVRDTELGGAGDSCVIDLGTGSVYDGVNVHDCGLVTMPYGTHGLYLKGPDATLRDSTVTNGHKNCVSIRFQGAVVEGNRLSGCGIGVAWFEDATAPGHVTIERNVIWDVNTGIYIDGSVTQTFAIANNTVVATRPQGQGIMAAATAGTIPGLTVENNIVTGSLELALRVAATGAAGYVERANDLDAPGQTIDYHGTLYDLADYRAASHEGAGSIDVDPRLASASAPVNAALTAGSPAIDAGVANPATGPLTASCDGSPASFCGAAPDLGAIEFVAVGPTVRTRPAPPSQLAARTGSSHARLSWRAPSGAATFRIFRGQRLIATVHGTTALIGGLLPGVAYRIGVATVAGGVQSSPARVTITARGRAHTAGMRLRHAHRGLPKR